MTQRATTALSLHYQVKPSLKEGFLVEIKSMLDRCAKEPEFIMGILHETPERPNEFVLHELWKRDARGIRRDPGDEASPKGLYRKHQEIS
jgi:quinol monooxygenase YgiN